MWGQDNYVSSRIFTQSNTNLNSPRKEKLGVGGQGKHSQNATQVCYLTVKGIVTLFHQMTTSIFHTGRKGKQNPFIERFATVTHTNTRDTNTRHTARSLVVMEE